MSLDTRRMLERMAGSLLEGGLVEPRTGYEGATLAGLGLLATRLAQDLESAADVLAEENGALRRLIGDAAPHVRDPELRDRLQQGAASGDASLRLSRLRAANAALRALLIELHLHVESREDAEAQRVDAAIWAELARANQRRVAGN